LPTTAVRLPGSPTPEPSPSSTSRSTRARQRRPVRCGHSATSPLSKTWAPVHHRSWLRSPGPSASGTSPLKPELQTRRTRGSAHLPRPFHRPHQDHQNQAQSASQRRRGVADLHRPRGCRRAERPDLGASTRDRRGTANRAERRLRERRCAYHGVNLATLPRDSLACGNAAGSPRCGNRSHVPQRRTNWVAAMITPTTVAVVLGGVAVLPGRRGVSGPASVNLAPSA
jgi:hypothetical protein